MAYTTDRKEDLETMLGQKDRPTEYVPHRPPIMQIMIFERGGRCILWIGPRGANLQEDMFSSLLSAICGFSEEALGLELSEIAAKQKRIFLTATNRLVISIVVNEARKPDYVQIKAQIRRLMTRILELVVDRMDESGGLYFMEDLDVLGFLRYEIELEIVRTFPSCHLNSEALGLNPIDIPKLRILTYLWDQGMYTFAKIAKDLGMPNYVVKEQLNLLEKGSFVTTEIVRFGGKHIRTYLISELGKLVLDRIESGFPGLWQ